MGDKNTYYNLTHPQKRIWYTDRINAGAAINNIGGCLKINKGVNIDVLKETINVIIKNNEGLRIRFIEEDGEPLQYVKDYHYENIEFWDFTLSEDPERDFIESSNRKFKEKYDLTENKLYFFALYKKSESEYGVFLKIHHIIADGWSISLIQKQICSIYSKLIKGESAPEEYMPSYIDYIHSEKKYLDSERFIKNKDYWCKKFEVPAENSLYNGSNELEGSRVVFHIEKQLSNDIKDFIGYKKISLNTLFIAAKLIYLSKTTGNKDQVVGTPILNRSGKKEKNMIGMFTSTVPLRVKVENNLSAEELIYSTLRELKFCLYNQKYPYDLLIKDLELNKSGIDSLFKVCVNYYNSKVDESISGIDVDLEEYYCEQQNYSLQITVKEWLDDHLVLNFDYKKTEYSEESIRNMCISLKHIIIQIINNFDVKIKDIEIIENAELKYKAFDINNTEYEYPHKTVNEVFQEVSDTNPDKVALQMEDMKITYGELNYRANQMARFLIRHGVKREDSIAIMQSNSIELFISILGVLKAGASYVPIDIGYPVERAKYMVEDSNSVMMITDQNRNELEEICVKKVNINHLNLSEFHGENLEIESSLNDLAYIIYTSGSTGKPKGVMIEQRGLINYLWWAKKHYFRGEQETMPLYSSISFDLTVTSIFTPLICGGRVLIYPDDEKEFVLFKILREKKVTVLKLTPAHLTLLKNMDNRDSKIKRFIVGGEDLKSSLAREIYNNFGKDVEIYNEYGPTETVVGCMIYKFTESDSNVSVPIGRAIDNTQVYILNNDMNILPNEIPGELYISGDGVARGYLNRDALTQEKFLPNPFVEGERMYRTGDRARYLKEGIIEYIGRIDNQIKLRGHRIELGEIEKFLSEHSYVKEAVAVIKSDSRGTKSLNAYIVCFDKIEPFELRGWLKDFLPNYMIPNNFIFLDDIPLTRNGKIDYSSLPDVKSDDKEFVGYKNNIEKELVEVMEEVLGVKDISMNDNYYQLGGDSIKAIQISSKLKEIDLDIKVKDIVSGDSVEEIASYIERSKSARKAEQGLSSGGIGKIPIVEWFFEEKFDRRDIYNQYVQIDFDRIVDVAHIDKAVKALIKHHDSLRLNYNPKEKQLFYNNDYLDYDSPVEHFELEESDLIGQAEKIKDVTSKSKHEFHIENSILFKVLAIDFGSKKQSLVFIAHHLLVDGISWRIILEDFLRIINQLEKGIEIKLPMKSDSLIQWTRELNEYSQRDFTDEANYWTSIIEKNSDNIVDFDYGEDTYKTSKQVSRCIDSDKLEDLIERANVIYNIDLNEILTIALAITINRVYHKEDIFIELERHGRKELNEDLDFSRTVGWFTSMYPANLKVSQDNLDKNIKNLKEQLKRIPCDGFNYGVIKYLKETGISSIKNKYIRFNFLGDFQNVIENNLIEVVNVNSGLESHENNHLTSLLDISAMIINRSLKIQVIYSCNRFKDETVEKLMDEYVKILGDLHDLCIDREEREFTPSDFDGIEISQEDLDSIFE